jgi:dethiobiotin synthase
MISLQTGFHGIFVAGTSTGVGKSLVAALLIAATKGSYWKPVQSGCEEMTDRHWMQQATGLSEDHFLSEAYLLNTPCSPHLAAEIDGVAIDLNGLTLPEKIVHRPLIVEGAGGIMVPINRESLMLDLMCQLKYPIILVASNKLGTINHTLLSLTVLRQAGLEVLGVVLNGPFEYDNKTAIEQFGAVHVLAELGILEDMRPETLGSFGRQVLQW